ncbi:MAG: hypothetical protein HZB39_15985 [Planctomycetes bacterium]|nr:hypothetical protein [Planctomycetota bacterium]
MDAHVAAAGGGALRQLLGNDLDAAAGDTVLRFMRRGQRELVDDSLRWGP